MYDLRMVRKEANLGIVPERLRMMLAKNRIKPAELARRVGISESTVSLILSGKRPGARVQNVRAMADEFGVSMNWLTGQTNDPTPDHTVLGEQLEELVQVARRLPTRRQRDLLLMARTYLEDSERRASDPIGLQNDLLDLIEEAAGQLSQDRLIELMRRAGGTDNDISQTKDVD